MHGTFMLRGDHNNKTYFVSRGTYFSAKKWQAGDELGLSRPGRRYCGENLEQACDCASVFLSSPETVIEPPL
jgi:hypothetical protein